MASPRMSMQGDARALLPKLPLPLAQLVLRALNAKNAPERHHSAYYLVECAIKLSASARVGVWLEHAAAPGSDIARKLEALVLPSTGHWCEILRELSRELAQRKDAALLPLAAETVELNRNRPDWNAVRAFIERAITEGCVPSDAAKKALKRGAMGFFEVVVAYRNDVIGHGAQRTNAFYDELGELLLAAALEVLASPALFGGMELVVARSTSGSAADASEFYGLTGLAGLPLNLPAPGAIAGQLYMLGSLGRISLHPLMLFTQDQEFGWERIGFINRTLRKSRKGPDGETEEIRRADYLDYASGQTLAGVDARAALTALLARLRGRAQGDDDIDAAANATLSDVNADLEDEDTSKDVAAIGEFELLGELGRGAMGIVYKAFQRSLKRVVALKVLPPSLTDDPIARKRFSREITALARCDHPNVVKILASGEDGNRVFYAMEYVEGADLARAYTVLSSWRGSDTVLREGHLAAAVSTSGAGTDRVSIDRDLPIVEQIPPPPVVAGRDLAERLTELFADVADGLAHLHTAGVIHRDLKPSNLMLTSDGKRIVITDLGLAKLADESKALTSADIKILGTLRYMAPEQLQRQLLDVDARADIYGLGATLYELVTCRRVFDGDTEQRLIYQVLHETPLPPRKIDWRISPDLAAVLSVAMAKSPKDRYATASAFADDLRAIAEKKPIKARPPNVLRRAILWARRVGSGHGVLVAAVLLVVLTPPAVLGIRSALSPRLCQADDVQDCTKQCNRKHPGSCYALGAMYEKGAGVPKDEVHARLLYKSACDSGHLIACYALGTMYQDGKGGESDRQQAARLFEIACNGNNAQSCNFMARLYQFGSGVPQDIKLAAELYKKSCDGGYATSCANLGRLHDDGLGLAKDPAAAHALYEKSCTMGSAAGCGNLAASYVNGVYVKQDYDRAFSLYKQGCEGGYPFACTGLGMMHENGWGVEKDPARAATFYKRTCDIDNFPEACRLLGTLVDTGNGVPKDEGRARVLFQQACEGQDKPACFELANMYASGRGVAKSEPRAVALFGDLCRQDMFRACTLLADFHEKGRGIPVNPTRAAELREKGCQGGDTEACSPVVASPPKGMAEGAKPVQIPVKGPPSPGASPRTTPPPPRPITGIATEF